MSSFTPRESCLDYLDLQGEAKDVFELKIAASFTSDKLCGVGCSLPMITTALLASSPIKEPELDGLLKIHKIFIGEVAPLVRQRWFSWDKVKLPRAMMKRIAKFNMKCATHTVRSPPFLSNLLLFPNPLSTGYRLLDSQPHNTSEVSSFSQSHDSSEVSTISLLSAPSSWSPSTGTLETNNLTFDDPNFMSTPISQQRNLEGSSGGDISGGDILGSAVTVRCLMPHIEKVSARCLTPRIAEREGLDVCPSPSMSRIKVNWSLGISPPPPMAPPFILAADHHQQVSTAPDLTVTEREGPDVHPSPLTSRIKVNQSLGISPPLPMAPPFILAADHHQQVSTAPDPAVTNSKACSH
ncbi:hypothetical protein EDB19DRAFT_1829673 [Suillus lakei]|nr:hypothetical protein EDB19DRAFT_1829673 [Suillus lakei]